MGERQRGLDVGQFSRLGRLVAGSEAARSIDSSSLYEHFDRKISIVGKCGAGISSSGVSNSGKAVAQNTKIIMNRFEKMVDGVFATKPYVQRVGMVF
jgi:hypothetical protein